MWASKRAMCPNALWKVTSLNRERSWHNPVKLFPVWCDCPLPNRNRSDGRKWQKAAAESRSHHQKDQGGLVVEVRTFECGIVGGRSCPLDLHFNPHDPCSLLTADRFWETECLWYRNSMTSTRKITERSCQGHGGNAQSWKGTCSYWWVGVYTLTFYRLLFIGILKGHSVGLFHGDGQLGL